MRHPDERALTAARTSGARWVPALGCTDKPRSRRYGDRVSVFPSQQEIGEPLLAFLQEVFGPGGYAEPPLAMTAGNDTQVYALRLEGVAEPLVLRVFGSGSDPRRPAFEGTLQNALAAQGLPVPRARAICTDPCVIGAPFFVMDRLPGSPIYGDVIELDAGGVPMADWKQMLRHGTGMLVDLPRLFAEVCLRIHAVGAKPVVAALEAAGLPWQELTVEGRLAKLTGRVDEYALAGLVPGVAWLTEQRPSPEPDAVLCHCDMQPLNLLMERGEVRGIIDWANASLGPPELDLAWIRAMFLTLELPLPGPIRLLERQIARFLSERVIRIYEREEPIDRSVIGYHEAFRSLFGLSSLAEQVVRGESIRDAWNSPGSINRVIAHVRERTGLEVSIPWPE